MANLFIATQRAGKCKRVRRFRGFEGRGLGGAPALLCPRPLRSRLAPIVISRPSAAAKNNERGREKQPKEKDQRERHGGGIGHRGSSLASSCARQAAKAVMNLTQKCQSRIASSSIVGTGDQSRNWFDATIRPGAGRWRPVSSKRPDQGQQPTRGLFSPVLGAPSRPARG